MANRLVATWTQRADVRMTLTRLSELTDEEFTRWLNDQGITDWSRRARMRETVDDFRLGRN